MTEGRARSGAVEDVPIATRLAPLLAIVVAIGAQSVVRDPLVVGPNWFAPTVEIGIVVALVLTERLSGSASKAPTVMRYVLGATLAVSSTASMALLIDDLLDGAPLGVDQLLLDGVGILVVAGVGFSVLFWQLDRGGPNGRERHQAEGLAFWFTQDAVREYSDEFDDWQPRYLDYLYLSATNVTAFSPTDTMPLTRTAKMLMLWESVLALATLGVILARAINILS